MDIFTTLVQTSKKLGVSAYEYLRDRLTRRYDMPPRRSNPCNCRQLRGCFYGTSQNDVKD